MKQESQELTNRKDTSLGEDIYSHVCTNTDTYTSTPIPEPTPTPACTSISTPPTDTSTFAPISTSSDLTAYN